MGEESRMKQLEEENIRLRENLKIRDLELNNRIQQMNSLMNENSLAQHRYEELLNRIIEMQQLQIDYKNKIEIGEEEIRKLAESLNQANTNIVDLENQNKDLKSRLNEEMKSRSEILSYIGIKKKNIDLSQYIEIIKVQLNVDNDVSNNDKKKKDSSKNLFSFVPKIENNDVSLENIIRIHNKLKKEEESYVGKYTGV